MAHPTTGFNGVNEVTYVFSGFAYGFKLTLDQPNDEDAEALMAYIEAALSSLHTAIETGESVDCYVTRNYYGTHTDNLNGF